MAKMTGMKGKRGSGDKKTRGRTSITGTAIDTPTPTRANVPQTMRAEANRAGPGKHGNKHRGDRRDTSKLYTNNAKHAARGNNPRPDVKTRAR